jgi:hypothetical protein
MARRVIEYSMANLHRQSIQAMIWQAYGFIESEDMKKQSNSKRRAAEYSVDTLREQWIEAMIKHGVGRMEASKHPPGTSRAEMARAKAARAPEPGKYFPVSRDEVEAAREAAYRSGVTFSTYLRWHLLRRNYEADPAVLVGPRRKVVRDPLPQISIALRGPTLQHLADRLDTADAPLTEDQRRARQRIAEIFADMARPLKPRRTKRHPAKSG